MELGNIIEGHANLALKKLGFENEEVEILAKEREHICRTKCPAAPEDAKPRTSLNDEDRCTLCHCVMPAKWRALNAKCIVSAW
jgi:hypothetical protein